jgi:glutaminase
MNRQFTRTRAGLLMVAILAVAGALMSVAAQQRPDPQTAVNNAFNQFRTLKEGKNADYIPALAKVDPNLFGIALVTVDGKVFTAGDIKTEVSIQSISKVFTMAQVIQEQGLESIEKRIGVDATGARFNSIIAIEGVRTVVGTGAPEMNPLVNPGAISATSMVTGANANAVWAKIIGFHNDAAGRSLSVLQDVYKSESDSNQRNQAIGALMLAYGYIKTNWPQAVDLYTRQCSIGVNAKDLATMAATLAASGKNPVTGKQVMDAAKVPGVLAVMATAGLYDDSGKWLYHTGLPAKSGVGGGLISSRCHPASSASPSCLRRSMTRATVFARSGQSPLSQTPSGATRWPQRHVSGGLNVEESHRYSRVVRVHRRRCSGICAGESGSQRLRRLLAE